MMERTKKLFLGFIFILGLMMAGCEDGQSALAVDANHDGIDDNTGEVIDKDGDGDSGDDEGDTEPPPVCPYNCVGSMGCEELGGVFYNRDTYICGEGTHCCDLSSFPKDLAACEALDQRIGGKWIGTPGWNIEITLTYLAEEVKNLCAFSLSSTQEDVNRDWGYAPFFGSEEPLTPDGLVWLFLDEESGNIVFEEYDNEYELVRPPV